MAKKVKEKKKVPKEKPKLASQIAQARVSGTLTLDFDFEIPCRNYNEAEQLVQKALDTVSVDLRIPQHLWAGKRPEKINECLTQSHDAEIEFIEVDLEDHCCACGVIEPNWYDDHWATSHSFETNSSAKVNYPTGAFIHEECYDKLGSSQRRYGRFS